MTNEKQTIKRIAKIAKAQRGWTVWMVGGFVRDFIDGMPSHDIDCVIEGAKSGFEIVDFMKQFTDNVAIHGERFQVVKAKIDGFEFDFTPPRKESSTGATKNDFNVTFKGVTIADDMRRRDFTFNSAAMNAETDEIFDPFGAAEAIENREITPTSDAFIEDPNRMRRGARFSARKGWKASEAMKAMAQRVKADFAKESSDVIWAEWQKWAADKNAAAGNFFRFFEDCGFQEFFPEINDWNAIAAECDKIEFDCNMDEFSGDAAAKRRETERRNAEMWAAMERAGADIQSMGKRMGRSQSFIRKAQKINKPQPQFKGSEIMAFFPDRKPGSWIRNIQNAIVGMERAEAKEFIRRRAQAWQQ